MTPLSRFPLIRLAILTSTMVVSPFIPPSSKLVRSQAISGSFPLYSLTTQPRPYLSSPATPPCLFSGTKMFHGSLEELYLSQETQVTSEQPPPCSRKMCRSVSMAYLKPCFLKPLREGPRERSLPQEGSMTEASTDTVSHRSSPEHGPWSVTLP